MPRWALSVLEWAVAMALRELKAEDVKREFANLIELVDNAVQAAESKVSGPFEGVADEVALAFHDCCLAIMTSLRK